MRNHNIRDYAEEIASIVGGEVVEIEKANGVKYTGITIREEGATITPNIYVDDFYKMSIPEEEAAEKVKESYERNKGTNFDVSSITDYEKAKPMLRVRLYNKATKADIKKSAKSYGYDDLVIIPYVELSNTANGKAAVKVTDGLKKQWNVSASKIIKEAINNTKAYDEVVIQSMYDIMIEMMRKQFDGDIPECFIPDRDSNPMYVVTNKEKCNGATSILFAKKELKKMFPNGYYVIPSSIHEVIVVPAREDISPEALTSMVGEVNESEVRAEEVLSDHVYNFVKEVA